MYWGQHAPRIVPSILSDPQPGKARGSPQFPHQGALPTGDIERLTKAAFRRLNGLFVCFSE